MANPAQRSRFLTPGDKLGRYELIRQIAVGGMAEIYLARTVGIEGFEKLIVVKRILPQHTSNASFVQMFLNEARLAASLQHPNIAQVYDIGTEDGDYFFAMEYVHGEDLDRLVVTSNEQGVPISLDAALTLVAGLCAGLQYAHDKVGPDGKPLGVVHRDVSPSNVLVSYDGAVKLVDFGIARAASRTATTQGGIKGKIAYMSPEQGQARAVLDRRSDVYSVGTILYELTTGQLPFSGPSEYAVLNQIVNNDVPPPSSVVPGYPPALEQIVLRALARDPDERFASAVELQQHVEDFAHESRLRISPLVLGRLMSNLFPARLEEWSEAKTQGAFFVEQHVVRTLIESGKTSDSSPSYEPPISDTDPVFESEDSTLGGGTESNTTLAMPPSQAARQLGERRGTEPGHAERRPSGPGTSDAGRRTSDRGGARGTPPSALRGAPSERATPGALRGASPSELARATPTRKGAVPAPVPVRPSVVLAAQAAPVVIAATPRTTAQQAAAASAADVATDLEARRAGLYAPQLPGTRVSGGVPDTVARGSGPLDGIVEARAANVDVTDRVRVREETTRVRIPRSGVPVVPLAIVGALAVAIAVFIALRPARTRSAAPPSAAPSPGATAISPPGAASAGIAPPGAASAGAPSAHSAAEPVPAPETSAKPPASAPTVTAEPAAAVTAEPAAEAVPEPAPVTAPEPAPVTTAAAAAPTVTLKPSAAAPARRKVKPKPRAAVVTSKPRQKPRVEPAKEPTWNADSPFLPVRKH